MKKTKYPILMLNDDIGHTTMEVDGYVFDGKWGIDKRGDGRYYLTHLGSGMMVHSSKKMATLKLLLQEPRFFEPFDHSNQIHCFELSNAVKRFCDFHGWG